MKKVIKVQTNGKVVQCSCQCNIFEKKDLIQQMGIKGVFYFLGPVPCSLANVAGVMVKTKI